MAPVSALACVDAVPPASGEMQTVVAQTTHGSSQTDASSFSSLSWIATLSEVAQMLLPQVEKISQTMDASSSSVQIAHDVLKSRCKTEGADLASVTSAYENISGSQNTYL